MWRGASSPPTARPPPDTGAFLAPTRRAASLSAAGALWRSAPRATTPEALRGCPTAGQYGTASAWGTCPPGGTPEALWAARSMRAAFMRTATPPERSPSPVRRATALSAAASPTPPSSTTSPRESSTAGTTAPPPPTPTSKAEEKNLWRRWPSPASSPC